MTEPSLRRTISRVLRALCADVHLREGVLEVEMPNGTIKRIVRDRGFGFLRDEGGQDWFFHRSGVSAGEFDKLAEGQRVSFDEEPSPKGPRATNIRTED